MGVIYDGPYAEDVNRDALHEGYPARIMPDGTLTSTWGGSYGWTGHVGFVAACDCGWRSDRTRPPGEYDGPEYEAALHDFQTQHLDPLIEEAKRDSWPRWVRAITSYATSLAELAASGRLDDADDQLHALRDEVAHRMSVIAELRAEQEYRAASELNTAVLVFTPLTDTPRPPTWTTAAPPDPSPPPDQPHGRSR